MTKKTRAVPDSVLWQDPFDDDFRLGGQTFYEALREAGGDPADLDAADEFMHEWIARWNEAINDEPVMKGLYRLAAYEGVWVGTEGELFDALERLNDPDIGQVRPCPSTPEELIGHIGDIYELSHAFHTLGAGVTVLDRREFSDEEAEDYRVPGWSRGCPILVLRVGAGYAPE